LETIGAVAREAVLRPPAVVVIGEVAGLATGVSAVGTTMGTVTP
jgi:siroheme synthase